MNERTMQGLGCLPALVIVGCLLYHFAFYDSQQSKYAITQGQNRETMIANAQGAVNLLVSRVEVERHVTATVTSLALSGSELRVSVLEKPKPPYEQKFLEPLADIHACEWAERIAMVAPEGVTVHLTLLHEGGSVVSRAKRPPGNKYFTHAQVEGQ